MPIQTEKSNLKDKIVVGNPEPPLDEIISTTIGDMKTQLFVIENERKKTQKVLRFLEILLASILIFGVLISVVLLFTNTANEYLDKNKESIKVFFGIFSTIITIMASENLGRYWARSKNKITTQDLRIREKDLYNNIQKDIDLILGKLPHGKYSEKNS